MIMAQQQETGTYLWCGKGSIVVSFCASGWWSAKKVCGGRKFVWTGLIYSSDRGSPGLFRGLGKPCLKIKVNSSAGVNKYAKGVVYEISDSIYIDNRLSSGAY
jgi:hypothetical protein